MRKMGSVSFRAAAKKRIIGEEIHHFDVARTRKLEEKEDVQIWEKKGFASFLSRF